MKPSDLFLTHLTSSSTMPTERNPPKQSSSSSKGPTKKASKSQLKSQLSEQEIRDHQLSTTQIAHRILANRQSIGPGDIRIEPQTDDPALIEDVASLHMWVKKDPQAVVDALINLRNDGYAAYEALENSRHIIDNLQHYRDTALSAADKITALMDAKDQALQGQKEALLQVKQVQQELQNSQQELQNFQQELQKYRQELTKSHESNSELQAQYAALQVQLAAAQTGIPSTARQSQHTFRSAKVKDVPTLTNGINPTWTEWRRKIIYKLHANRDHFVDEEDKLGYALGCIGGHADELCEYRYAQGTEHPFLSVDDLLDHLEDAFNDVDIL